MSAGLIVPQLDIRGNSPQSQQFFDRLFTPTTTARETLIKAVIDSLVASGVWILLDGLFLLAATDAATSCMNLISNKFQMTCPLEAGTFVVDRGWTPLGASNYLDFGFDPSVAGNNFTQNSGCLGAWNRTATSNVLLGSTDSSQPSCQEVWGYDGSGNSQFKLNCHDPIVAAAGAPDATGLYISNRTGASVLNFSRNGSVIATSTVASVAPSSTKVISNANNAAQLSVVLFGGGLTNQNLSDTYSAIQPYMSAVGAA